MGSEVQQDLAMPHPPLDQERMSAAAYPDLCAPRRPDLILA
eukprot:CAMPEP_0170641354 /NCGR_PEP_ID=MMETSP0224-20130122/40716_1 /TAXON_ID=285029 /ORGANISM="Togula jolla, Strain CCCM 725" /LENGTH=40 /DNA_ID= /DNA_START= /DNA_END= /DNA_ORIENTATION=